MQIVCSAGDPKSQKVLEEGSFPRVCLVSCVFLSYFLVVTC